jgi:predicted transcriptional regulator
MMIEQLGMTAQRAAELLGYSREGTSKWVRNSRIPKPVALWAEERRRRIAAEEKCDALEQALNECRSR